MSAPAAVAAARAAGQAASIPHMGAHALGTAAYAAKAAGVAAPDRPEAVSEEICWQLRRMSIRDLQASLADPDRGLPPIPQVDQEDGKEENRPVEVLVRERLA